MKSLPLAAAAALAFATPVLADMSPAERFGALKGNVEASAAANEMAIEKLSGADIDDRIMTPPESVATRSTLMGNQIMAADLGVDASDFTTAELVKMYIGKYD